MNARQFYRLLLAVLTSVTLTCRPSRVRMAGGLTVGCVPLAILLMAGAPAPVFAQHVFSLPEPTGEFAVVVSYLHLVDEDRPDPFLDGTAQPRELMVKLCYPAVPDPAQPFARYFHGSAELTQAFAEFFQLPGAMLDHLSQVDTHAKENLAVSPDEPTYPVILFSHGAGTSMEVQTTQCEDLASHGYVVAAIDHTFVSAATGFPGRIVRASQATTMFDVPEPAAPITQIMADDVQFVIQELEELNSGEIASGFQGRLNLDALGVIGHSVGGAVAYDLAITDPRVKAAINLDGAVYVAPEDPGAIAPFLMVASDTVLVPALKQRLSLMEAFPRPPADEPPGPDPAGTMAANAEAIRIARQNMTSLADVLQASGNLYTVTGCDHMQYTDVALYFDRQTREQLQIMGETEPARCLAATSALTVAFFDHHLKGETVEPFATLTETYPELRHVALH